MSEELDLDLGKDLPITKCYECGSNGEGQDGWWSRLVEYQGELLWAKICDVCYTKPTSKCKDCEWVGNHITECGIKPTGDLMDDPDVIGVSCCPNCGGDLLVFGD